MRLRDKCGSCGNAITGRQQEIGLCRDRDACGQRVDAIIAAWSVPVGGAVVVTRDRGQEELRTRTRSLPWKVSGQAVVMVEGISGGYALERVRPDEGP